MFKPCDIYITNTSQDSVSVNHVSENCNPHLGNIGKNDNVSSNNIVLNNVSYVQNSRAICTCKISASQSFTSCHDTMFSWLSY